MSAAAGAVLVFQGGMPAFVDPLTLSTQTPAGLASMSAALASANAAIVALTQRVAALEGKPDPCVALSGSLPLATLQLGTVAISMPVVGLLATDRIVVQPAYDLPAGLVLAWARPKADGLLIVALDAVAVPSVKASIPLMVTALR